MAHRSAPWYGNPSLSSSLDALPLSIFLKREESVRQTFVSPPHLHIFVMKIYARRMTEKNYDKDMDVEKLQGDDEESSKSLQIHPWISLEEEYSKLSHRTVKITLL
jgi:hypothetical protein